MIKKLGKYFSIYLIFSSVVSTILIILAAVIPFNLNSGTSQLSGVTPLGYGGWFGLGCMMMSIFAIHYSKVRLVQISGIIGSIALIVNFGAFFLVVKTLGDSSVLINGMVLVLYGTAMISFVLSNLFLNVFLFFKTYEEEAKTKKPEDLGINALVFHTCMSFLALFLICITATQYIFRVGYKYNMSTAEINGASFLIYGGWIGFGLIIVYMYAIRYSKITIARISGMLGNIALIVNIVAFFQIYRYYQNISNKWVSYNYITSIMYIVAFLIFLVLNIILNIQVFSKRYNKEHSQKTEEVYEGARPSYCALCGAQIGEGIIECPSCKTQIIRKAIV